METSLEEIYSLNFDAAAKGNLEKVSIEGV